MLQILQTRLDPHLPLSLPLMLVIFCQSSFKSNSKSDVYASIGLPF